MKRILAIDGGGIRGIFALQILMRVEELLRQEHRRPNLVLADVFDLIAGTSTGAIIAVMLAWGKSAGEIEDLYVNHGGTMFCREKWFHRLRCKYRADVFSRFFREHLCEDDAGSMPALLGSKRLRTKLLMVMRNASSGKTWVVTNHPDSIFNDSKRPDCDLNIPLWQLLRATTAAPTFFSPEQIAVGEQRYLFVDGGVTPFANPTLVAVLRATMPQYRICWPTGRDKLHVISVGTGLFHPRLPEKAAESINYLDQLRFVIPTIVSTTSIEQDLTCRIMGDCIFGHPFDAEIGDLRSPTLFESHEQKFTYVRYDQALDAPELAVARPMRADMDNLQLIPSLRALGRQYAADHVKPEHFGPRSVLQTDAKFPVEGA
jgi:hypothetical protein